MITESQLARINAIYIANSIANRPTYQGLTTEDISDYNHWLKFGDVAAEDWDDHEWSLIVD